MTTKDILPSQLTGPYAIAYAQSVINESNKNAPAYTFLQTANIYTNDFQLLYDIGLVIGVPWPTTSLSAFNTNLFQFGSNSGTYPITTNTAIGFSDSSAPGYGGIFADAINATNVYIPADAYRPMLLFVAKCKWGGFNLKNALSLASTYTNSFTINFNSDKDLEIHYTVDFGTGYRGVIQRAYDLVTTAPHMVVSYP